MPLIVFSIVSQVTRRDLIINYDFLPVSIDAEGANGQSYLFDVYRLDVFEAPREVYLHHLQDLDDTRLALTADPTIDARDLFVHI